MGSESSGEKKPSIQRLTKALAESERLDFERKALRRLLAPAQLSKCLAIQDQLREKGKEVGLGKIAIKSGFVTESVLAAGVETLKRSLNKQKSLSHQTSYELEAIVEGSGDVSSEIINVSDVQDALQAERAERAADLTGERMGSFELARRIGRSPVGETYIGRRVGNTVPTAVKVYEVAKLESIGLPNLIFDRMRTVGQIKHANLTQPLGCGRSSDRERFYFAVELVQGINAQTLVQRRGRVDEKTALSIAISAAKGLSVVHGKGLVHGNLKPSNLLVSDGGIVRVCDTGMPRSSQYVVNRYVQEDMGDWNGLHLAFVPPELIEGQTLQPSADTYGIGVLLCHMLSGQMPFEGEPEEIMQKISSELSPFRHIAELPLHSETKLVIETMVNRAPSWRYEDMPELIGALRGALNAILGLGAQVMTRVESSSGPEAAPAKKQETQEQAAPAAEDVEESNTEAADPLAFLADESAATPEELGEDEAQKEGEPAAADSESPSGNVALLAMLEQSQDEEFQWQSGVFPGSGAAVLRSSPNLLAVTPESFIGRSVGPWELEKILGYGIVADMYRGRHSETGQVAAIKVFLKQILNSKAAVMRFKSRCRVSTKIDHPNMLGAYDFGQSRDGYCYVAMEYLSGRSLKRLIRRNGFIPVRMALGIILFAARGLMSAHKRGIIHGNLKPPNILVNRNGIVKICDTGTPRSSEIVVDEALVKELPKELKAQAVAYIPPEIVIGAGDLTPQTDVYGLGMILYHMITGRVPFKGKVPEILKRIQRGDLPKFVSADKAIPEPVRALTMSMVGAEPDDRIKNMSVVIEDVRAILDELKDEPEQRTAGSFHDETPPSSEGLRLP